MAKKVPYLQWTYSYKKNLFDLFITQTERKGLKQPFDEQDIFTIFKKMTGQKVRSSTYKSLLMVLADEKVQIKHDEQKSGMQ